MAELSREQEIKNADDSVPYSEKSVPMPAPGGGREQYVPQKRKEFGQEEKPKETVRKPEVVWDENDNQGLEEGQGGKKPVSEIIAGAKEEIKSEAAAEQPKEESASENFSEPESERWGEALAEKPEQPPEILNDPEAQRWNEALAEQPKQEQSPELKDKGFTDIAEGPKMTRAQIDAEANRRTENEIDAELQRAFSPEELGFLNGGLEGPEGKRSIVTARGSIMGRNVEACFAKFSPKDRKRKENIDPGTFASTVAGEIEKLNRAGINISGDAYWKLRKEGIEIKRAGLFGGKVKVIDSTGPKIKSGTFSKKKFNNSPLLAVAEKSIGDEARNMSSQALAQLMEKRSRIREAIRVKNVKEVELESQSSGQAAEAIVAEIKGEAPVPEAPVQAEAMPESRAVPEPAPEAEQANNFENLGRQFENIDKKREMKEMKDRIAAAKDMGSLLDVLKNGITDYGRKDGYYPFVDLAKGIAYCLSERNLIYVSRTFGLRDKVKELTGITGAEARGEKLYKPEPSPEKSRRTRARTAKAPVKSRVSHKVTPLPKEDEEWESAAAA